MVVTRKPKQSDFVLATVVTQPDKKDVFVDLSCFKMPDTWPGSPEILTLRFNGEQDYFPKELERITGDALLSMGLEEGKRTYEEVRLLLLAKEERYRRTTTNLEEFLYIPPSFPGL